MWKLEVTIVEFRIRDGEVIMQAGEMAKKGLDLEENEGNK
jgi:hypothetical protein